MGEPEDPFRADMPEFDRPEEARLAELLEGGAETANALTAMEDMEAILRAVLALTEGEARAALAAFALSHLQRRLQESGEL